MALFIAVFVSLAAHFYVNTTWLRMSIQLSMFIGLGFVLLFFRNPKRALTVDNSFIKAPADGKIVQIKEVMETEYFKDRRLLVSIFMSPLNIHVTRYPISGTILYSSYHPGHYLVAWHPKSSEKNEHTTVVINHPTYGTVLYRQIAGAVARRIVNYAEKGMEVVQSTDAGFIKFGSRIDLLLPVEASLNVVLHQKVKGGIDPIAQLL